MKLDIMLQNSCMRDSNKDGDVNIESVENIASSVDVHSSLESAYQQIRVAFLRSHPNGGTDLLDRAFEMGRALHLGQCRKSGEQYFFHPLAVAKLLVEWRLDAVSIACGLLHDTVEDTLMTNAEIRKSFGDEIAEIVDGLTKISKLDFTDKTMLNAENVRKLLVAMDRDVRVLLVKLADRLHNMRTLSSFQEEKRRRIARETRELYAPLANRLGMYLVCAELEDLAFANLDPERYIEMRQIMDLKRQRSATMIDEIRKSILLALGKQGIAAKVFFRVKHLYSIWKKMGVQEKKLEDIYDWLAYRVICPDRTSCYAALGLVHALYRPIPGSFKDYVSLPKDNDYKSLHTSVMMPSGESFEVQFRTQEMDDCAEVGIAAHWAYKDGYIANKQEINQVSFLRRMVELHKESRDSGELVTNLKGELEFKQIQVFTPKGDLRSLPEHSTPVDFAYAIHTQVGHHCVGAKVNGCMVPLRHVLQSGDRVEIFTSAERKPGRDWLSFVASARARTKIQMFIRDRKRASAISSGKERFEREAKFFEIKLHSAELCMAMMERLKELKFPNWDAFYASIGFNRVSPRLLLDPFIPKNKRTREEEVLVVGLSTTLVADNVGVLYTLANCCKPIWGDKIVGYTTAMDKGILIHRDNCPHLGRFPLNEECKVSVGWGEAGNVLFDTELIVNADDRHGMVAAISTAVQNAGFSLQRFSGGSTDRSGGVFYMALRVRNRDHLVELIGIIRRLKGVVTVERVRGSYFGIIN